jgi:hypothetical protein
MINSLTAPFCAVGAADSAERAGASASVSIDASPKAAIASNPIRGANRRARVMSSSLDETT